MAQMSFKESHNTRPEDKRTDLGDNLDRFLNEAAVSSSFEKNSAFNYDNREPQDLEARRNDINNEYQLY